MPKPNRSGAGVARAALLAAFVAAACAAIAPRCHAELVVRVHLVPQAQWAAGNLSRDAFLRRGTVHFYRSGSPTPEVTAPLNETVVIPEGDWDWVAAGPDGVGWERGNLPVPPGMAAPGRVIDKKLLRPAVPACRVTVTGEGPGPVAVLSLTARALFPLPGGDGWVPAGEGLVVARGAGGGSRLGRLDGCDAGEHVRVPPPRHPPSRLPALLLSGRRRAGAR